MTDDQEFHPDGFQTFESKTHVKIAFQKDDGTSREIVIPRSRISFLVAELTDKIEQGQVTPISRGGLRSDRSFRTTGWGVQKLPNGGLA